MPPTAAAALVGYRRLLRSARVVFRGDSFALRQAQLQLRDEFQKHREVREPAQLQQLLQGIDEVDELLRFNIVQGQRNERGNFEVRLEQPQHQATIMSAQDDPHGIDISPVDKSVLGDAGGGVQITKTKGHKGHEAQKT